MLTNAIKVEGFEVMHRPEPLLPPTITPADYDILRTKADIWLQVMRAICQQHGLPTENLVRFGNSTDPEDGSCVVFATGEQHIIKLFPPNRQRSFEADLSVAEHVYDKLIVATPKIYAHDQLDGWLYIVMSRLQGVYLSKIWHTLVETDQLRLLSELAGVLVHLHTLSTQNLPLLDTNWSEFVASRINGCVQRHREQGVSAYWLEQIPSFLNSAAPLYPPHFTPAIISGDIHQYHLLATQENGHWRLTGLFDFDDALLGFHEYNLAAAGLFMMAGRPTLLRRFFLAYGYKEADINEQLSQRLLAYTLLHRYRPFNWVREDFV